MALRGLGYFSTFELHRAGFGCGGGQAVGREGLSAGVLVVGSTSHKLWRLPADK